MFILCELLFACKDVDSLENSILGEFPTGVLLQMYNKYKNICVYF